MASEIGSEKSIKELEAAGAIIGKKPVCVRFDWAERIIRARAARELGKRLQEVTESKEIKIKRSIYDKR